MEKILDLAKEGYRFFPCNPKSKAPATKHGFYDSVSDPEKLKKIFSGNNYLYGFPCGDLNKNVIIIDLDTNKPIDGTGEIDKETGKIIPGTEEIDQRTTDELLEELENIIGPIPRDGFKVQTLHGGLHLYFQAPEGVKVSGGNKFFHPTLPIDVCATGQYVIFPDEKNYFVYDSDIEVDDFYNHLPPLPENVINFKKQKAETPIIENQEETLPETEIREIRSALAYIDAGPYINWYQVGMALKSTGSPTAFYMWRDWSNTSEKSLKNKPGELERKWRKLDSRDITIASLFHMAKQVGWVTTYEKNVPALLPNPLELQAPPATEMPSPERIKEVQQKYEKKKFPVDLLRPPGLAGMFIDYIMEKSMYKQPVFAVSATLAAIGALGGRKYRTEDNARTNIYCLNVGASSAGKETARKYIKELFDASGCGHLCEISKVSSDAAIETEMYNNNSQLFLIDEYGRFLQAATDGRAPAFLKKIVDVWMELYSQCDQTYTCKAYADGDRKKKIEQPNLCILGTTVPESLYEKGLSYESATDGFLSRMMIFESYDKILRKNKKRNVIKKPPVEIIDQIKALFNKPINMHPEGNVDDSPDPQIVYRTEEAQKLLDDFDDYIYELKLKLDDAGKIYQMFGRTSQTAEQIALIVAIGVNIDNPVITKVEMAYGIRLALFLSEHMQYIIENFVSRTDTEHELKKILRIIRQAGIISHEEILKEMQHLKSFEMNDILQKLEAQNRIQRQVVGQGEFAKVMITIK